MKARYVLDDKTGVMIDVTPSVPVQKLCPCGCRKLIDAEPLPEPEAKIGLYL